MFDIKIDTRLKVDVGGVHRIMKIKNDSAIREIVDTSIRIIRDESPDKTGVFKLSVKRLDERRFEDSEGSAERHIRIGPSIHYAKYVLNRTRPSAGRYFPQFDVRLRGGQHPGTREDKVLTRAKRRLRAPIEGILRKHYGSLEVGRFIR